MSLVSFDVLRGLTGQLVTLGLAHSLWIGLLAASTAAIVLSRLQKLGRSASTGYLVLLGAFVVSAIGPLVAVAIHRIAIRPAGKNSALAPRVEIVPEALVKPASGVDPDAAKMAAVEGRQGETGPIGLAINGFVVLARSVEAAQSWILGGWLVVAAGLFARLGIGAFGLARLIRSGSPPPPMVQAQAAMLAAKLGLKRVPRIRVLPVLDEPCLAGLRRPTLLIPGPWLVGASSLQLDAILAHELSHARRLDLPVNLAQRIVENVLFFHPAIHWLSRALRYQRERCADSLAVWATGNPHALAIAIESVARFRLSSRRRSRLDTPLSGDSLFPSHSLLSRIQELIGMTPPPSRPARWPFAAIPTAGFLALVAATLGFAEPPAHHQPAQSDTSQVFATDSRVRHPSPPIRERSFFDVNVVPARATMVNARGPASSPRRIDENRQISYEVRIVTTDPQVWRNGLEETLTPIAQDAEATAWILDEPTLGKMIRAYQNTPRTSLVQAPKVTAFERDRAVITSTTKTGYVSRLEKQVSAEGGLGFRPLVNEVDAGLTVHVLGTIQPAGVQTHVDLKNAHLLGFHTLHRDESATFRDQSYTLRGTYQVPRTAVNHFQGNYLIPNGSTLLVSLGLHEVTIRNKAPGRFGAVAGLIESLGFGSTTSTQEQLVLITPRPIILEPEAQPGEVSQVEPQTLQAPAPVR
jgi:beta-lactamase regulating signal transducer with metallopeptidase domain